MSTAARSLYGWSIYVFAIGAALAVIPNTIFDILRIPETEEVWVRVLGIVLIILALYYWDGARHETRNLFVASLLGRTFAVAAFIVLWLTGGPWQLMIFAAGEVVGIVWTTMALRADAALA